MANESATAPVSGIEAMIHLVRGYRVLLDTDLAGLYGVTTSALNQAVKRNQRRFPEDFAFQLAPQDFANLKSQFVIPKSGHGGRRRMPWAFTEHGAIMLASVLNSERAIQASVRVVRVFVQMREMLSATRELAQKFAELEARVSGHDEAIARIFEAIRQLLEAPPVEVGPHREIGFHVKDQPGQPSVGEGKT